MDSSLPPDLVLRRRALAEGWSDDELVRSLQRGDLTRLRPGAHLSEVPSDPLLRHRYLVTATLAALRRPAVVSHQSAAVLHGWPLWGVPLDQMHVTRRPPSSSEVGRHLRCHVTRLDDEDVVTVAGMPVTHPARTALDLARTLSFEPAVVALDAAMRPGGVPRAEVRRRLADARGTPGSRAAARAAGWGVVRWTWPDLTPQVLGPRVQRALDRGWRRRG
ncbi:hypothetical protein [Geodermatophilus sabuli]|uniref:Transcriptional regulator, AbiEi antitoxin, Type IV TA system n=1 Tax=Geodermatophilus sabuli TaxID=1564158 RepID=A0A285E7I3_9ACTN|nr:hypothetical protein [Geodermatophilus sabuli]MBB3082227.1 hypothetical protein [Geodermatophilus sabuli]SNX94900.1 Transcriptional regulator, AbiEi antitoxin, Type IV TA system [Geodermatophilus sabuli]